MKRITILLVPLLVLLALSLSTASAAGISKTPRTHKTHPATSGVASLPTGYTWGGYSSVTTGSVTSTVGPLAPVGLACNPVPTTVSNSANLTSLGSTLNSGTAQTTITTSSTSTSNSINVSSTIQNLSILSGLISASHVHAAVNSMATATGGTSTNNSTFTGLTVAGVPILTNPAPNTSLTLPGVGYLVLNEQSTIVNGATSTSINVNALDVNITLGANAGTRIILGHANSSEVITAQRLLVTASSYGFYALGLTGSVSTSTIGPLGAVAVSCIGGSATASSNGVNSSLIGSVGAINTTVSGQITSNDANATGQTKASTTNLLSGLIQAGSVALTAHVDFANGVGTRSGSLTVTNGSINGTALGSNPPPNTRINLPNLGYVIVNEQYGSNGSTGATEAVLGFDINITTSNSLGLPIGARIIEGFAYAKAATY